MSHEAAFRFRRHPTNSSRSLTGASMAGPAIRGSVQEFSITGLIIAFVGAVILLAIVNFFQRHTR